jgi:spore coat protein CotH
MSCKARGVRPKTEIVQLPTYRIESDRNREGDLDYVFDLEALPVITIEISSNDFNTVIDNYDENPGNKDYVIADFIFDKDGKIDRFDNIGFRLRGGRWSKLRLQRTPGRYDAENAEFQNTHFRISFNTFVENGRFYRLRNLILKWHNQDPIYAREVFCYDLFNRFDVNASRASYARVYLRIKEDGNEIAYGVYIMIEPVDRSFLQSRYNDNLGHLWKCGYGGGPGDLTMNLGRGRVGMEDPDRGFRPAYDFKTHSEERGILFDDARGDFEEFVENLNTKNGDKFEDWITNAMDVDSLLRLYAVNVLVNMWDDYWMNGNNYYLYRDSEGKWHFIPWDYDNTMGTSWGMGGNILDRDLFQWGDVHNRPLMNKIMERPNFRASYSNYLVTLIDENNDYFNLNSAQERIKKWHKLIEDYVDPDRVDTIPSRKNNFHTIEDSAYGNPPFTFYTILSGDNWGNYIIHRIETAKKQLGIE